MQNWEMNPVVIKNDRYKSAEIAYMEIQKYCKVKGYMFFPSILTEKYHFPSSSKARKTPKIK